MSPNGFIRVDKKECRAQESEDRSFFLSAMVAFSKLSVMVAAPAAANQLFAVPAPYAAAPQVAPVMGPATATVAEPVLFLQPTYAGAQESETNGSWANAGAFCAGAAVAAGAVALASAQSKRVATLGTGGNAVLSPTKAVEAMAELGYKKFPIDLSKYDTPKLDPFTEKSLPAAPKEQILANVQLCGDASGYGGHTGGAYDTVPEVCLLDAMFKTKP